MVGIHLIQFPHFGAVRFDEDLDALSVALDLVMPITNVAKTLPKTSGPE